MLSQFLYLVIMIFVYVYEKVLFKKKLKHFIVFYKNCLIIRAFRNIQNYNKKILEKIYIGNIYLYFQFSFVNNLYNNYL